jgi:hypothetical protein
VKLPNGSRADIGTKLEDYCLNASHRQGQHKARVFHTALGITLANAEILRLALKEAATNSDEAIDRGDNSFGRTYELRFRLRPKWAAQLSLAAGLFGREKTFQG